MGQLSVLKTGVEISTGTFLDHLVYGVLYQRLFFFIKLIKILYVDHCCSSGNLVLEAGSSTIKTEQVAGGQRSPCVLRGHKG